MPPVSFLSKPLPPPTRPAGAISRCHPIHGNPTALLASDPRRQVRRFPAYGGIAGVCVKMRGKGGKSQ